jgi:hypothetical protein
VQELNNKVIRFTNIERLQNPAFELYSEIFSFERLQPEIGINIGVYSEALQNFMKWNKEIGWYPFSEKPFTNMHFKVGMHLNETNFLYFGEMRENTSDIREGRGIHILENGSIYVGKYTDDAAYGIERRMYANGTYVTGKINFYKQFRDWIGRDKNGNDIYWFYE